MKNERNWFFFYGDELNTMTVRQVIEMMADKSGVSDPRRYHIREINDERVAIALYQNAERDYAFISLQEWSTNLDSSFFDEGNNEDWDLEE